MPIIKKYILNCFLLILPILLGNAIYAGDLPPAFAQENFNRDIPPFLLILENILRSLIFVVPAFMPIRIQTGVQKFGLLLFLGGTVLYAWSWYALISSPDSEWSRSLPGFLAPAYTPIFWLTGIGLIGSSLNINIRLPYQSWIYIALSFAFVSVHVTHAWLVYSHIY